MVSIMSRSTPTPGPPADQRTNLFGESIPRLVEAGLAQRLQMHAERPDGTRDAGRAGLLVGELTNRLAGDCDAGLIDVADLIAQAVALRGGGRSRQRYWFR